MTDNVPPSGRLRAALQLLFGQAEGLRAFPNTPEAVWGGLKPFIGLGGFMGVFLVLHGQAGAALVVLALLACSVLLPLVTSHFIADRMELAGYWFRYAAAVLWSQWTLILLLMVPAFMLTLGTVGTEDSARPDLGQLTARVGSMLSLLGLGSFLYMVWLQWFLARRALGADPRQALLIAVGSNVVLLLPRLLGGL